MASQDGSGSSDDDDYDMHQPGLEQRARYAIHDCCEFEDAETLRVSPHVCLVVFHRGIHRPWSIVGWRELMGWVSLPPRCSFAVGRLASPRCCGRAAFSRGMGIGGATEKLENGENWNFCIFSQDSNFLTWLFFYIYSFGFYSL